MQGMTLPTMDNIMNTNENGTFTVQTKLDARAAKTETRCTIDWSNATREDLEKLATKSLVIAAQAEWRSAGVIPSEAVIDAHAYANPTRRPRKPADPAAIIAALSPEERAALFARFQQ